MRVVVALVSAVWLIATCQVGAVVLESKLPPAFFLRTDHMGDGVILHDSAPSMSWRVSHFSPGEHQTAFQVVVIDNANDLVMWDTGRVASRKQSVKYMGPPLSSDASYSWRVWWWDTTGLAAPPSETVTFGTALLSSVDWADADWIAGDGNLYRTNFTVTSLPSSSRAYVSGLGWFQLFINGKRVGSDALSVGWSRYDKRAQYASYDVTSMLVEGENAVGVMLGYGWRNETVFVPKDGQLWNLFMRQLRFKLTDGTSNTLVASSSSWRVTQGPILRDSVYNGELYDARREQDGWSAPGFANASHWKFATVVSGPGGAMYSPPMEPIQVMLQTAPVSVTQLANHTMVLDFGANAAGFCTITMPPAAAGTAVVLRYAEILMHEPYGPRDGNIYTANLRTARATDTYIMRGLKGGETYTPHFTYHGFRYVQVTGYPGNATTLQRNIMADRFYSALSAGSSFDSSSVILNTIQANAVLGQQSNLMSIPTDCDQRDERLGWMGDAGLSSDSMAMNFQTQQFHANYLDNIHDELDEDGSLPDVTPFYRFGNRPADVSWSAAFPQILWVMLTHYNLTDVVSAHWDGLQAYLGNLHAQLEGVGGNIGKMPGTYGDWVTPGRVNKVSVHYTSGFNYILNLFQSADIATALGHHATADDILATAHQLGAEFHQYWYHANNASYADGRQTAFALALHLKDVVPAAVRANVSDGLLNAIVARQGTHISTGIIGAKALFPVLSAMGRTDVAVDLLQQTTWPSWGFMAFNNLEPATTLWELWSAPWTGPGMNSRNHHMFSSVSQWILATIGGLGTPGCDPSTSFNVTVAPALAVSRAMTTLETGCGSHSLSYERMGGTQCVRAPESQSTFNEYLPAVPSSELSCGTDGGVIKSIDFASFGMPLGSCGAFAVNTSCHAPDAQKVAEELCLGKQGCTIPSDAPTWHWNSDLDCPGVRRLFVQATCSEPSSLTFQLTTPWGSSTANVSVPLLGLSNPTISLGKDVVWKNGQFSPTAGVAAATYSATSNSVTLRVTGGSAGSPTDSFKMSGQANPVRTANFTPSSLEIACPTGMVVTSIPVATYRNLGFDAGHTSYPGPASCDLGAAKAIVERACMGKNSCSPVFHPTMFSNYAPACVSADLSPHATFTCSAEM